MPDNFITALLGQLNAPVTPEANRFLDAWTRAEGTKAAFNPLATTQGAPGATSFNSVNVRNYPDFNTGLRATAQTLLNGRYDPIVQGLRSGTATATQLAQAVANSPWGTGGGVLRALGSPAGATAVPTTAAPLPSGPAMPSASPPNLGAISNALVGTLGQSPGAQLQALMGALGTPSLQTPMPSGSKLPLPSSLPPTTFSPGSFKPGTPVPSKLLSSVGAEHPTAGLEGFPAYDYMARAGTPVVAPVGGKIVRFSGHDPSQGPTDGVHGPFGWSLYLQGNDGHTYYMTHLGSRDVKVGQTVKPGAVLATIGDYAKWGGADHVHMGVH